MNGKGGEGEGGGDGGLREGTGMKDVMRERRETEIWSGRERGREKKRKRE